MNFSFDPVHRRLFTQNPKLPTSPLKSTICRAILNSSNRQHIILTLRRICGIKFQKKCPNHLNQSRFSRGRRKLPNRPEYSPNRKSWALLLHPNLRQLPSQQMGRCRQQRSIPRNRRKGVSHGLLRPRPSMYGLPSSKGQMRGMKCPKLSGMSRPSANLEKGRYKYCIIPLLSTHRAAQVLPHPQQRFRDGRV